MRLQGRQKPEPRAQPADRRPPRRAKAVAAPRAACSCAAILLATASFGGNPAAATDSGGRYTLASGGSDPHLEIVGQIGGPVHSVALTEDTVVAAAGARLELLRVRRQEALGIEPPISASPFVGRLGTSMTLPGIVRSLAVDEQLAYAAVGDAGLALVDLAAPKPLPVVGQLTVEGEAWDVAIAGSHALVAAGTGGLAIVSIADPASPRLVATTLSSATVWAVDSVDELALVGATEGLYVVDVGEPSEPRLVGELPTPTPAIGVDALDETAFLATREGGLVVVDFSEPGAPVEIGRLGAGEIEALGVFAAGDRAYVAVGPDGVWAVDVADPSAPRLEWVYATPDYCDSVAAAAGLVYATVPARGLGVIDAVAASAGKDAADNMVELSAAHGWWPRGVALAADRAYVAAHSGGLRIFSVRDPTAPVELATLGWPTEDGLVEVAAYDIAHEGQYAYVAAARGGLRVVDVRRPTAPVEVGAVRGTFTAEAVEVADGFAYVAADDDGVIVFDVTRSDEPAEIARVSGSALAIAVDGDRAIFGGTEGITLLDVSQPRAPRSLGRALPDAIALEVALDGPLAAVAVQPWRVAHLDSQQDYQSLLTLVDVSDPHEPRVASTFAVEGDNVTSVALVDGHAVVGTKRSGIKLVEVGDPANPTQVASIAGAAIGGFVWDVAVDPPIACLAAGSGLSLLSLRDIASPAPLSRYEQRRAAYDVHVADDWAYTLHEGDGLQITDLLDPTAPRDVGVLSLAEDSAPNVAAHSVFVAGEHAYLGSDDPGSGLQIVDVSDPTLPRLVARAPVPVSGTQALDVSGGIAYAIDGEKLRLVDVSHPDRPRVAAEYDSPASALDFAGGYLYLAAGEAGMRVLDVSDPEAPREVASYDPDGDPATAIETLRVVDVYSYAVESAPSGASQLSVIDIRQPAAPREIGRLDDLDALVPRVSELDAVGDVLAVAGRDGEIALLDMADRSAPSLIGRWELAPNEQVRVHAGQTYYALAARAAGLRVVTLSGPQPVTALPTWLDATGTAFSGGLSYVSALAHFVPIVDATNRRAPALVGADIEGAASLHVSERTLYSSTYAGELRAYNLLEPAAPRLTGKLDPPWNPGDISVSGNLAYVAAGEDGLRVLDLQGPDPVEIGRVITPGVANSVASGGGRVYVGTLDAGVVVVDASDPHRPTVSGHWDEVTDAWDIEVVASRAYVAAGDEGLTVLDLTTRDAPDLLGVEPRAPGVGLSLVGPIAYIASPDEGLIAVDVSQPDQPRRVASRSVPGIAQGVKTFGAWAHVATFDSGLWIMRLSADIAPGETYLPALYLGSETPRASHRRCQ